MTPKARVVAKPSFIGRNAQTGENGPQYGTPDNLTDVSWWSANTKGQRAPLPGEGVGNNYIALLLGHTASDDKSGVFLRLSSVKKGDSAVLWGTDAKKRKGYLTLVAIKSYKVSKTPQRLFDESLAKAPKNTRVATATCIGDVDPVTGHHEDIRVVLWDITAWTPVG